MYDKNLSLVLQKPINQIKQVSQPATQILRCEEIHNKKVDFVKVSELEIRTAKLTSFCCFPVCLRNKFAHIVLLSLIISDIFLLRSLLLSNNLHLNRNKMD